MYSTLKSIFNRSGRSIFQKKTVIYESAMNRVETITIYCAKIHIRERTYLVRNLEMSRSLGALSTVKAFAFLYAFTRFYFNSRFVLPFEKSAKAAVIFRNNSRRRIATGEDADSLEAFSGAFLAPARINYNFIMFGICNMVRRV